MKATSLAPFRLSHRSTSVPIRSAFGTVLLLLALLAGQAAADDPFVDKALVLHEQLLSLDAHVDIPLDFASAEMDPGTDTSGQIDLPKMGRGQLSGAVFSIFVPQDIRNEENYARALADAQTKLDAIWRMAEQYPERIGVATSPRDIQALRESGRHVAVVGMLNGFPLGAAAQHLDDFYERGLRQLGFTHAGHNNLADSSRPRANFGDREAEHNGLSDLGKAVIGRLNELGVIVDVSQLTPAGVRQAVAVSKTPVIASHSAARALVEHPRNLSDADMKLIADNGGVICIVAFSSYLINVDVDFSTETKRIRARFNVTDDSDIGALSDAERQAYGGAVQQLVRSLPVASIAEYVDVIDYVVNLVGVDHVGISSDFNNGGRLKEWQNAGDSYKVTAELLRRGYSESDIRKIWGDNWLRVFTSVTAFARSPRT